MKNRFLEWLNNRNDLMSVGRKIVYALRHDPKKFGLSLDNEGWVDLHILLKVMNISEENLVSIMSNMDKKRLEVKDGKIRAAYGHSVGDRVERTPTEPPDMLYHGTAPDISLLIQKDGLRPMQRQYVHLSTNPQTAIMVGKRKHPNPSILKIDAKKAAEAGVKFYLGNEDIWMADYIPPQYIH